MKPSNVDIVFVLSKIKIFLNSISSSSSYYQHIYISFCLRYLSASNAAIQPEPAAVIACL